MEAFTSSTFPTGPGWQYEPKWDGFRCLIFRNGESVKLQSRSGKWLTRYFPEVVAAVQKLSAQRFVLDSELIIVKDNELNFDLLLQRLHPAASRIKKLSVEIPARAVVFDLLAAGRDVHLKQPLQKRRQVLTKFARANFKNKSGFTLSPATQKYAETKKWLARAGSALDGLIAKRLDEPYHVGERGGMQKLKFKKTADCIVGGFRLGKRKGVASLLLGLYDKKGLLHHIGFTSSISNEDRAALTKKLKALKTSSSFTGAAPGGPSRWNSGKENKWFAVKPNLVCEVEYDHFTRDRFRHGTKFLRWRPDKPPKKCGFAQVRRDNSAVLLEIKS